MLWHTPTLKQLHCPTKSGRGQIVAESEKHKHSYKLHPASDALSLNVDLVRWFRTPHTCTHTHTCTYIYTQIKIDIHSG